MTNLRYNKDGTPLTANQIALQKVAEANRIKELWAKDEVDLVLKYADKLGLQLKSYIKTIDKVYTEGGVQGFKFTPKNYEGFKEAVKKALHGFAFDDPNHLVSAFMGSDAKKNGYSMSIRSKSDFGSLHVELGKHRCDVHYDSKSVTPAESGYPYWGHNGQYDPTRFLPHAIQDLLPSYLHNPPSWLSFFSELPVISKIPVAVVSEGLSRTSLDLKVKQKGSFEMEQKGLTDLGRAAHKETRFVLSFKVLEWL